TAYISQQLLKVYRLHQMLVESGIVSAPYILRLTVSGERYEPRPDAATLQPPRDFVAVNSWQADVEKNDFGIKRGSSLERFRRAKYRLRDVSREIQDHRQGVRRVDVVIHDENTSLYVGLPRLRFHYLDGMGNGRQYHLEAGSASRAVAGRAHTSAVHFDEAADHRQPYPESALRAVEGSFALHEEIEDSRQQLRGDPDAIVGDGDRYLA